MISAEEHRIGMSDNSALGTNKTLAHYEINIYHLIDIAHLTQK